MHLATTSSKLALALCLASTSARAFLKSCGTKTRFMATAFASGKATSAKSLTAFGTRFAKCCSAAAIAWILSNTLASRFFSSRFFARISSFLRHRTSSSATWASISSAIFSCRLYQSPLKRAICSISCSSSVSMIDCSKVLFMSTSRMGSTSLSKTKSSPSSTCVETSTPVFCSKNCSGGGSGKNSSVCASTACTSMTSSLATR
mmetsp:Transcript_76592/g.212772  ORF Transcript_76592/g.212772 Transcript_76592/m.212772 type:complete len:204 (-) Transcript_76592:322-933(-)